MTDTSPLAQPSPPRPEGAIPWRAILVLMGCTVAVAFNVVTVFNGTMTVFIGPLSAESGWSRGQISLGLAACMLALLLLNPVVGRFADKVGPARVILLGAPVLGLAIAALGWMPLNYPLFLAGCTLVGVAGTLTYHTLYYMLMTRWFDRRLGLALGITASGTGVGFMAAPIAAQALITEFGWRGAYVSIGVITTVVVVAASLLLIRDRPKAFSAQEPHDGPTGAAWRSLTFLRLALIYFLTGMAINGTMVHVMPFLTDRGTSPADAAAMASVVGIGVLLARLGAGLLLDYVDTGRLGAACFIVGAAGMALLVAGPPETLIVGMVLIGVSLGAEGDVLAYVTRRLFGGQGYGANISLMTSSFLTGVLIGPPLNGLVYDLTGAYTLSLSAFTAIMLFAAILHFGVTRGRRPGSATTA